MADLSRKTKRRFQAAGINDFNQFYLDHYGYVKRVAIAKCYSLEEAELVAQETMVKAWRAYERFDHKHPKAWLNTILIRVVIDRFNKLKRERAVIQDRDFDEVERTARSETDHHLTVDEYTGLEAYISGESHAPFEQWSQAHLEGDMKVAMESLSHSHRSILIAREVLEFSYQEIADLFSLKSGTVMSRLFRARSALHQALLSVRNTEGMIHDTASNSPLNAPSI
jgi:RNA polymerase sigma-70 factor (ECF subfamily)